MAVCSSRPSVEVLVLLNRDWEVKKNCYERRFDRHRRAGDQQERKLELLRRLSLAKSADQEKWSKCETRLISELAAMDEAASVDEDAYFDHPFPGVIRRLVALTGLVEESVLRAASVGFSGFLQEVTAIRALEGSDALRALWSQLHCEHPELAAKCGVSVKAVVEPAELEADGKQQQAGLVVAAPNETADIEMRYDVTTQLRQSAIDREGYKSQSPVPAIDEPEVTTAEDSTSAESTVSVYLRGSEPPVISCLPRQTPLPKSTINSTMLVIMHSGERPECWGWSSRQWATHLGCSHSTIVESDAWRNMKAVKVGEQLSRGQVNDRRRRPQNRSSDNK
jgi:hypothetical protein